jgi:hypothetical protein
MLKWKSENDFRQPKDLLRQADWCPSKSVNLLLIQEVLKKLDVEDDADDEVRTTVLYSHRYVW